MPSAPEADEALGGKGRQQPANKKAGKVQAPGDILRGTETRTPATPASPNEAQRFAADQSFGDDAHKAAQHEEMEPATSRGTLNLSEEE